MLTGEPSNEDRSLAEVLALNALSLALSLSLSLSPFFVLYMYSVMCKLYGSWSRQTHNLPDIEIQKEYGALLIGPLQEGRNDMKHIKY